VPSGLNAASGGADLFTGDVKITADKNTNSLVIVASTSDYRNVLKVIQQLDIPRRQVFVEAVIMEISLEDDLNLGASLHGGKLVTSGTNQLPLVFGSELGSLNSLGGVTSLASLNGFLAGIQGPPLTIPGTSLSIPSFAILVNALQSSSDVNVISTPTVTMTDNSEGEITVGQNVPFQAGYSPGGGLSSLASAAGASGSATSSLLGSSIGLGGLSSLYAPIQRQNVELRLKIKPQINQGEYVRLEVDEQTEEIASTDPTLGPTTSKRSAKTTVLAKDQETVVIGGLIQERTIKGVSKTPILGSIPVLGWLFRNETSKKTKTNLLLFLTPYIIRDQSDYRRIFERKMSERAEFVKRFTGADANYVAAIDYGRKASPLARLSRTVDLEMNRVENGGPGISGERAILPSGSLPPPRFVAPPVDNAPVNQQTWPAGSPTPAATKAPASRQSGSRPPSDAPVSDPGGVVAEPAPQTLPDIPASREPGSVPPDVGPDERAPATGVIRPGTSTDTKP
jgi:general secretion pathway protein D